MSEKLLIKGKKIENKQSSLDKYAAPIISVVTFLGLEINDILSNGLGDISNPDGALNTIKYTGISILIFAITKAVTSTMDAYKNN